MINGLAVGGYPPEPGLEGEAITKDLATGVAELIITSVDLVIGVAESVAAPDVLNLIFPDTIRTVVASDRIIRRAAFIEIDSRSLTHLLILLTINSFCSVRYQKLMCLLALLQIFFVHKIYTTVF